MVVASEHLYQTIVLPRKLATGSIHDYFFCYCPLVGILFEVLRIPTNSESVKRIYLWNVALIIVHKALSACAKYRQEV